MIYTSRLEKGLFQRVPTNNWNNERNRQNLQNYLRSFIITRDCTHKTENPHVQQKQYRKITNFIPQHDAPLQSNHRVEILSPALPREMCAGAPGTHCCCFLLTLLFPILLVVSQVDLGAAISNSCPRYAGGMFSSRELRKVSIARHLRPRWAVSKALPLGDLQLRTAFHASRLVSGIEGPERALNTALICEKRVQCRYRPLTTTAYSACRDLSASCTIRKPER